LIRTKPTAPKTKAAPPPNKNNKAPAPLSAEATLIQRWVEQYGDLVFDLCSQTLPALPGEPSRAPLAFRAILKALRAQRRAEAGGAEPFVEYERAWVLHVACAYLLSHPVQAPPPPVEARLDADLAPEARLNRLDSYLDRLGLLDRILLLLRDKYGLPYPEIAIALESPEDSLKLRRSQALRALQDWVWEGR
jgi:hypothetical protein